MSDLRMSLFQAALLSILCVVSACGDGSTSSLESSLLWDDFYSGPLSSESTAIAEDIAACDGSFFVVGETYSHYLVRAYAMHDGTLQWHNTEPFVATGIAGFVACDEGRIYATGRYYGSQNVAFVRAYDRQSGATLWEFIVDEADWNNELDLVADSGYVYLLTKSGDATAMDIWALDGSTGGVRWRAHDEDADVPSVYARLTVSEDQVCSLRDGGSGPYLRCFDRASGELAWYAQDVGQPGVQVTPQPNARNGLAAFGRGEGLSGIVAAYDPRSGELLWNRDDFNAIVDVHVYGDRVLVSGVDFDILDPEDPDELIIYRVTGLDMRGGTVWEDRHLDEAVRRSVISEGRLFVAGEDWHARIYDPDNGRLIAQQSPESSPRSRWAWDIAAEGDSFAIVGATFRGNSNDKDFAVRAYELSR